MARKVLAGAASPTLKGVSSAAVAAEPGPKRQSEITMPAACATQMNACLFIAATVKLRWQSPSRPPCDTTPALSPGQPEPGNWGCRYVSALSDRKSRREQVRPADHSVRPPCVNTTAPTRHRPRKDRHVHVRAGRGLHCDRALRLVGWAARLAPSRPAPPR